MHNRKYYSFAKIFLVAAYVSASLLCAGEAYAQTQATYTIVPLATLPGLTTSGTPVNPTTYVQGLYAFAIGIGAVIAVIMGVWTGIEYMLSETSVTSVSKAKERMWNVLWGAVLLFCSYLLLNIINPQLVTWNLALGTLNNTNLQGAINANNAGLQAQQALQTAATQSLQQSQALYADAQTAQSAAQTAQNNLQNAQTAIDEDFGGYCPNNPSDASCALYNKYDCANNSSDPECATAEQQYCAQNTTDQNCKDLASAQTAATAAQTVANQKQLASIQGQETTTLKQITANLSSDLNNNPTVATQDLQSNINALNAMAAQAVALGNPVLATQISAQAQVAQQEGLEQIALQPMSGNFSFQDAVNAENAIGTAQDQLHNLIVGAASASTPAQAAVIQAQATALNKNIIANQASLDTTVEKFMGSGCTAKQYIADSGQC